MRVHIIAQNNMVFFLLWSIWLSLEFLLGPYSHVRIHDAGDGLLPQLLATKIQFTNYGFSYFADYMTSGVDSSSIDLLPFTNFNSLIFSIFPGWLALSILMFLQRFISSYFTYKFVREILKIDLLPSVIAALLFSLFNFSTFSFTIYHQLGLANLPLVLYLLEKNLKWPLFKLSFLAITSGLVFGYTSYFTQSTVYLLPFIFFYFLAVKKQLIPKVVFVLLLFSTATLAIQFQNIYALLINSPFSHRTIWDLSIRFVGWPQVAIQDFLGRIWVHIVPIAIVLISLKFKKQLNYRLKILLTSSAVILIFPSLAKYLQVLIPKDFSLVRTFSFDRFEQLAPFILAITASISLHSLLKNAKLPKKFYIYSIILLVLFLASLKTKIETLANYAPYRNLYMHPQLVELAGLNDWAQYRVVTITGGGVRSSYPLAYGLYTVDSYLTLYPKTYHDFWQKVIEKRIQNDKLRYDDFAKWGNRIYLYGPGNFYDLDKIEFTKYYDLDLLSFANVKYIISQRPVEDPQLKLLPSAYREDLAEWDDKNKIQKLTDFLAGRYFGPPLYIYENKTVLPRFFTFDNGQISIKDININFYSPDKIILSTKNQKTVTLITPINYYPWWKVTVNDKEALVAKSEDAFMSFKIPAGENLIKLEYDPPYKFN